VARQSLSYGSRFELFVEKYEGHLRRTFDQLMDSLGYTFDETIGGETNGRFLLENAGIRHK
jgi:hypothetical protein